MIRIYNCNDLYLYEIIEDYKDAKSEEDKNEIFNSFCSLIWNCDNKRRTYKKSIKFNVKNNLIHTEIGQIFDIWSRVEYRYYKSMTKDKSWYSIIRQKINNIYTRYFDKEVILANEYIDLIKTPKNLYYEWINGKEMNVNYITNMIDDAISKSEEVKNKYQMQKMNLTWNEYKKVIEVFLKKCFDNCKLIGDYEDKNSISSRLDFLTEDHFYVGYISRCLNGNIKDYEKRYSNLPQSSRNGYKRCKVCGVLIENQGKNKKYCSICKRKKRLESKRNWWNSNH